VSREFQNEKKPPVKKAAFWRMDADGELIATLCISRMTRGALASAALTVQLQRFS